jgi:protein SCO1/2
MYGMFSHARKRLNILILLKLLLFVPATLFALEKAEKVLGSEVGLRSNLGTEIDLSLSFTNQDGKIVTLKQLVLEKKPLIIVPVYYECPRLCGLLLSGFVKLINQLTLSLGDDYAIATISFDPREGVELAKKRADQYRTQYRKSDSANKNWHFLVGDGEATNKLMDRIGFLYREDGEDFAHTAAIMILTADGILSQYFTGIEFSPFDTRLAIVEASNGAVGTPLDHVFLFCFRFDESVGKYTWAVFNLMRAAGVLTLLALIGLIFGLYLGEKKKYLGEKKEIV